MTEERREFCDTTLRNGEQSPGCSMNLGEKIKLAKQLVLNKCEFGDSSILATGQNLSTALPANTLPGRFSSMDFVLSLLLVSQMSFLSIALSRGCSQ